MENELKVALVGNPNTGKTTLFNLLTGACERTGNWTGVTVDRALSRFSWKGRDFELTDLPGIYSFSPFTADERVARDNLISHPPDAVINLIDASNLERSLYLTSQLLDMRLPLVVVLNQMDIAESRGIHIDVEHLRRHLGCPVVVSVASKGVGREDVMDAVLEIATTHRRPAVRVLYDVCERSVQRLQMCLMVAADDAGVDSRWLAIKLLEKDPFAEKLTQGMLDGIVAEEAARILHHNRHKPADAIMDSRLGFIRGLTHDVVTRKRTSHVLFSDKADRLLLSRTFGIPVFLGVMYAVFWATVRLTQPLVDFVDTVSGALLVDAFRSLLEQMHSPEWVIAVCADGAGAGVTTLLTFIPPIFMIFFCLSLLEESGYMSRAAFIMDRFLNAIGLPGKAFIPLLVGFGCTVPALMATRTLEQRCDRLLTMLIAPFMSCGARMPVYAIFAMAFFPRHGNAVIFSLYLIGAALAILTGWLLHKTIFTGNASAFVMELPPYHVPPIRGCLEHVWFNLKSFLCRAGKVILTIAMVLSLAGSLLNDAEKKTVDRPAVETHKGKVAQRLTTVLRPMGVEKENWQAAAGLMAGIMAKEAIVGTLEVLYANVEDDEEEATRLGFVASCQAATRKLFSAYGILPADPHGEKVNRGMLESMRNGFGNARTAFAYLLFVLIYTPCLAALLTLGKEAGWRWMVFALVYQTLLAWMVSTFFYQVASFSSAPLRAGAWLAAVAGLATSGIVLLRVLGKKRILYHETDIGGLEGQ